MSKIINSLLAAALITVSASAFALPPQPPHGTSDLDSTQTRSYSIESTPSNDDAGGNRETGTGTGSWPSFGYGPTPPAESRACARLSYSECYYSDQCYTYVNPTTGNFVRCVPI